MMRGFFYIQYLPENLNAEFLTGRCIRLLHGFMTKNQLFNIGLSFPSWSEASVGNTIAFISKDSQLLTNLKSQKYFLNMAAEGYFKVSDVIGIPPDFVTKELIFFRERQQEKLTPAARLRNLERLKKRAEARGEIYQPAQLFSESKLIEKTHPVPVEGSNRKMIQFNLGKIEDVTRNDDKFSSYGLGSAHDKIGTVPCVKPFFRQTP
ncbi:MAG: type I-F CRISPR-associated endoribonuclease Cas6/Csy4 [Paraglaciecola sp.]|uniref:type I-F CRISPR-associated endoribonuclease Cas6/Csy4 n=1 Tax=Alishewanella sp. HL-SH05 TaxID=3461145 RepID=UPI00275D6DA2|nr:type I-F CRISPR-associated endoribonuclease Cas6/Csy4 [Paraglaciecola sp.]